MRPVSLLSCRSADFFKWTHPWISFKRATAVACGIAPNQLLVGAQPVAPSCQFVEGGLLVALVEIAQMIGGKILNKRQFGGICRVEFVVGQADAQCVVVQMLFVCADVGIVDEGFAEGYKLTAVVGRADPGLSSSLPQQVITHAPLIMTRVAASIHSFAFIVC